MSYHDECATRCPGGQRGKDGREEDGYQETQTRNYGCETRSTAFGYACTTLNECCDRRASEQGTNRYEEGICAVGQRGTREISVFAIYHATETHHGIESGSSIDDINVEKCEECKNKLGSGVVKGPVELIQCLLHWMPCNYLFEEIESRIPFLSIWEVSDSRAAPFFPPCQPSS